MMETKVTVAELSFLERCRKGLITSKEGKFLAYFEKTFIFLKNGLSLIFPMGYYLSEKNPSTALNNGFDPRSRELKI